MKPIPIAAAKRIAKAYGYDQVIIIARALGQGEHCTTYGVDKANCDVAARIGDFLKFKVMKWAKSQQPERQFACETCHDTGEIEVMTQGLGPDDYTETIGCHDCGNQPEAEMTTYIVEVKP